LTDSCTGRIYKQFLDPALGFGMQPVQALLILIDPSDRIDDPTERLPLDPCRAYANAL
jgi:hypothetical protein